MEEEMRFTTVITLALFFLIVSAASAQYGSVPNLISYQGYLEDTDGTPLDGDYQITFAIYDELSGGVELWSSGEQTVSVENGLFTYHLGSAVPLPTGLFGYQAERYLSVTVASEEIQPRTQLVTVPFSFYSDWASFAEMADMAYWIDCEGCINSLHIEDESVATNDIQNGTILFEDMDQNSASSGQVMKWNGSAWAAANDETSTGEADDDWEIDGNDMYSLASGNVGIGTSSPDEKLEVWGNLLINGKGTIGPSNTNTGSGAFVAGSINEASGNNSTVLGNQNVGSGWLSTVGGGQGNIARGSRSTISGGYENVAESTYCAIGGGQNNRANGWGATVGGGSSNSADTSYCTVGGGSGNAANQFYATVAGGASNSALGSSAAVGGGQYNYAGEPFTVVAGGRRDTASGYISCVVGGQDNVAGGGYSLVVGGDENRAEGELSSILGGTLNSATGKRTVVLGCNSKANHNGSVVISANSSTTISDSIRTGGAEQIVIRADGGIYIGNNSGIAPYDLTRTINVYSGAYLTTGGVWTNASDRNLKENFSDINNSLLLEKISQLQIRRWNYKSESDDITHIGPVAQDFHALFNVGGDDKAISTIDPAGIALAAIQALNQRTRQLEAKSREVEDLSRRVDELTRMVNRLLSE